MLDRSLKLIELPFVLIGGVLITDIKLGNVNTLIPFPRPEVIVIVFLVIELLLTLLLVLNQVLVIVPIIIVIRSDVIVKGVGQIA